MSHNKMFHAHLVYTFCKLYVVVPAPLCVESSSFNPVCCFIIDTICGTSKYSSQIIHLSVMANDGTNSLNSSLQISVKASAQFHMVNTKIFELQQFQVKLNAYISLLFIGKFRWRSPAGRNALQSLLSSRACKKRCHYQMKWRWILELGVKTSCLTYKDLCCLSMSCRRLNCLSKEDVLWSTLLSFDFPTHPSSSTNRQSLKSIYQIRFEKDKAKKLLAERRVVLKIESQIHEHTRRLQEIEVQLVDENEKIKAAIDELKRLRKVKEASTALKVWQPEIIRSRQKQIVENCSVPVDFRINALQMEIKLCKQLISGFLNARKDENSRLEAAKDQLSKVKYHPLQSFGLDDESRKSRKISGKKLKRVKHE
ncbi:hypothetical protein L1987_44274 [Smallanthus sonchifolius]|uniref:Uncharacterized protein n=1 Tax=Smallanthus sonchifolius TaxID=185202 RepID=A0ACB9GQ19_9ASTR|nr:hypothetical protein L1987_44274 [Smallanthus sonchifolius]